MSNTFGLYDCIGSWHEVRIQVCIFFWSQSYDTAVKMWTLHMSDPLWFRTSLMVSGVPSGVIFECKAWRKSCALLGVTPSPQKHKSKTNLVFPNITLKCFEVLSFPKFQRFGALLWIFPSAPRSSSPSVLPTPHNYKWSGVCPYWWPKEFALAMHSLLLARISPIILSWNIFHTNLHEKNNLEPSMWLYDRACGIHVWSPGFLLPNRITNE